MKFDEDLMQEVMDQAPPGVIYERAEVHAALVWAMDARPLIIWPTAIQKAARAAITCRRAAAAAAEAACDDGVAFAAAAREAQLDAQPPVGGVRD